MTAVRTFARSFAGGEVTKEFFGRIDDVKNQTGLEIARNFDILPHGPAANRTGTHFVKEVKDSTKDTRLIPFEYSDEQTLCIEMGDQYFRFHTLGATVLAGTPTAYNAGTAYAPGDLVLSGGINYYCIANTTGNAPPNATYWYAMPADGTLEIPTTYLEADLFDIHYVQSKDIMTFVHPSYPPRELRRLGATTWTLTTVSFISDLAAPADTENIAGSGSGSTVYKYLVTAVDSTGREESLASEPALRAAVSITSISKANPGVFAITAHGLAVGERFYVDAGDMVEITTGYYLVNTVPTSDTFTIKTEAGVPVDTTGFTTYSTGGTIRQEGIENDLLGSGAYNTITWTEVTGAERYKVYKQDNGLYGYIGQTDQATFDDANITADISQTPPIAQDPFNTTDNYPQAVSYAEQRRLFGGTNNQKDNMWMTREGSESNLSYSIPTQDSDAISFRFAALKANTIRHIVPLGDILTFTSSALWKVTSVNSDKITPESISVKQQSGVGASNVQPLVAGENILYEAARGGHVMEVNLAVSGLSYTVKDIARRSSHLFNYRTMVDAAFVRAPYPIAYYTSSYGILIGLTYIPDEEVAAWFWYDTYTNGGNFDEAIGVTGGARSLFKSVCAVPEGDEDFKYVIVQRVIDGAVVQYIERFASRNFAGELAQCYFVDCGVSYDGNPQDIEGITAADPGVVTITGHNYSNDDVIDLDDITGMTELNGLRFVVANKTADTFELNDEYGNNIDTSAYAAYTSGGICREAVSTLSSGLDHLEGETVAILGDGSVRPLKTVSSGSVTLDERASILHVGLPVEADLKTLPIALEVQGFAQGRVKNVNQAWVRVHESSGIFVGPSFDKLVEKKQRTDEPYGLPPALQSAELPLTLKPKWTDNGAICIRQSNPLPLTVVAIGAEVEIA